MEKQRIAVCGACGGEELVTEYIRKERHHQFKARPSEPTDLFYCGCQNDPDEGWPPSERFL